MNEEISQSSFFSPCLSSFYLRDGEKKSKNQKNRARKKNRKISRLPRHRKAERLPLFHSLSLSPRRIQQQQHLIMVSVRKRISRTFFCHQQMHELLHFVASNRACEDVVVLFALLIFLALSLQAAAAEKELLLT
jgi:hypothetical protein